MSWQPIETAPNDGTDVLVYFGDHTPMLVAFCYLGAWQKSSGAMEELDMDPTHWAALPEPPQ